MEDRVFHDDEGFGWSKASDTTRDDIPAGQAGANYNLGNDNEGLEDQDPQLTALI